jgi:hypothetical protein
MLTKLKGEKVYNNLRLLINEKFRGHVPFAPQSINNNKETPHAHLR